MSDRKIQIFKKWLQIICDNIYCKQCGNIKKKIWVWNFICKNCNQRDE
jgi:hypothetical protein